MSWLGPIATAAGRGAVRMLPAARRDWARAIWAEAFVGTIMGLIGSGFANVTGTVPDARVM